MCYRITYCHALINYDYSHVLHNFNPFFLVMLNASHIDNNLHLSSCRQIYIGSISLTVLSSSPPSRPCSMLEYLKEVQGCLELLHRNWLRQKILRIYFVPTFTNLTSNYLTLWYLMWHRLGSERRRLGIVLAPTNPERIFQVENVLEFMSNNTRIYEQFTQNHEQRIATRMHKQLERKTQF